MSNVDRSEFVDFEHATPEVRSRALETIAGLCEELFDGPGLPALAAGLRGGGIAVTMASIYYARSEAVGFALIVLDKVEGEPDARVIRELAMLRPAFRGGRLMTPFWVGAGARLLWRNRRHALWHFTPAQHVAAYRILARNLRGLTPHPDRPVTPAELERITRLARQFKCERGEHDHPLSCTRGVWLKGSLRRGNQVPRSRDRFDVLFEQIAPHNAQGGCVMTMGRIRLTSVVAALAAWPLHLLRDAISRRLGAHRAGLSAPATDRG